MAQGYKDFVAGAVLTAADLEDYNQNQSIMRFATAAARNTALTSVLAEGMCAYLIDSNTLTVYSGTAWSTVGPVHGAWLTWTPAVVQGATPTLTVERAAYCRIGRMVTCDARLLITSAGTAANIITVSLPVAPASNPGEATHGAGFLYDASATQGYTAILGGGGGSLMRLRDTSNSNPAAIAYLGTHTFTAALANGDYISINAHYEAAADA